MNTIFKVAVIVPTYNLEKIINRTMDNLVRQKGIDDMEVIAPILKFRTTFFLGRNPR